MDQGREGDSVRTKQVTYFTKEEEELTNILVELGTKKNVAKALAFFAYTPEATSREIERGTDLCQPEVSVTMQYMSDRLWIKCRRRKAEILGPKLKVYELAKPLTDIMESIEKDAKRKTNDQLKLIKKLRNYVK